MERPPLSSSTAKRRIAFVVDWLNDAYQTTVLEGALEVAKERGANIFVFPGGVLGAAHGHGTHRNTLYRLVTPGMYDGVIAMTGTLTNAQDADLCQDLFAAFDPHRVCHVGFETTRSPCVLIDNQSGVRKTVEHLIRAHNCKHIAYLRGPVSNPEAEARFSAYLQVLDSYGMEVDPRLILPGDFRKEAAVEALRILFDERQISPSEVDAIVAADDSMALAVLEDLRRRNIKVPAEIAVVGFDDVPDARYALPPLSSIRQPLEEQGREAMNQVLNALTTETPPTKTILETSCRFRRSCGCTAEEAGFLTERPKVDTRLSLKDSMLRRRNQILDELRRAGAQFGTPLEPSWEQGFYAALLEAFAGSPEQFRSYLDELLEAVVFAEGEVNAAMSLISGVRQQLSVCAGDDPNQIRQVESLLHEARMLTAAAMERAQAGRRLRQAQFNRALISVSCELSLAEDLDSFRELISQQLPLVGVKQCWVCRYLDEDHQTAQLVATVGSTRRPVTDENTASSFASVLLNPVANWTDASLDNYVVQPLYRSERHLGYAVFSLDEIDGPQSEVLGEVLSLALERALPS